MKYIEGYGTRYTVTTDGKVFNNNTGKEIGKGNNGKYKSVNLVCENGIRKQHKVHRLVASTFLCKEEGKGTVDHIDGNRLNNSVDNLRWCSDDENQKHRTTQRNDGREDGIKGAMSAPIRIEHNGIVYESKNHLARELSKQRGATEQTLKKRIREVIARKGTLYGFPIKILQNQHNTPT